MPPGERMEDGRSRPVEHSLVQAIRAVPSLASVDDAELLALAGESANLVWAAGSRVVALGSEGDGLYVVLSGSVRVLGEGGEEVGMLGPGEFFGEFSLLTGKPRQHDIVAVERVELMVVPRETVGRLLASRPEFAETVRAQLEVRLASNSRLAELGS
jgi:trk system potassium uptake protein TrkA